MGYRRYKRRYQQPRSSKRRGYRHNVRPQQNEGWLVEQLLSLITGIGRLFRFMWRRVRPAKPHPIAPVLAALPTRAAPARPLTNTPPQPPRPLPYRPTKGILSKGERALWVPLYHAVKGKFRIFCKVRLADVVAVPEGWRTEPHWFRKVCKYHVDFVITDPDTTAPLLVLELDDRSHVSEKRKLRDEFKSQVLRDAGVPLYRVRAEQAYDPIHLRETIHRMIRDHHLNPTPHP